MNAIVLMVALSSPSCPPVVYVPACPAPPVVWMPARVVYPSYPPGTIVLPPRIVAPMPMPAPVVEKSLFERLGGAKAVEAVVDDFVARTAGNPKVNFARQGTPLEWKPTPENVARLKKHLVQLVTMVTGGPTKYEGRSMKAAHTGMGITDAEFDALAADLKATLDKFKVAAKEQAELLKIVGSTRGDIVEKK
jgi:truncated hemoglobin YjbI